MSSSGSPSVPSGLRPDRVRPTDLSRLIAGAGRGVLVSGVSHDSRTVRSGDLYVALPGQHVHGARFATQAVAAGAVAVLTDPAGRALLDLPSSVTVTVVADPRALMAPVAATVYGRPAEALTMFGVTGTNGKTTTAYLLGAAARAAGLRTGLVGTLGFSLDGEPLPTTRSTVTTPEAPDLQALLAVMVERGASAAVMEVSSHALVLGRTEAIVFDVAAFTNFGRDHLDFHGDEESYFEAKASLFTPARSRYAVVNVDDPRGRQVAERVRRRSGSLATLSLGPGGADFTVRGGDPAGGGPLTIRTPRAELEVTLGLPGDFNVRNALTALAMLDAVGVDLERAAAGLTDAVVPGRMQRVALGDGAPTVYVDFAHTPQAVRSALVAARLPSGRLTAVLGSGGDRDPDKRGPMGAAAARSADVVVVTDDNPRSENPEDIRRQVLAGAHRARAEDARHVEVVDGGDRRSAIALALAGSGPSDVVAILGKGHETGQQIGPATVPFDDAEVVAAEWRLRTATVRAGLR